MQVTKFQTLQCLNFRQSLQCRRKLECFLGVKSCFKLKYFLKCSKKVSIRSQQKSLRVFSPDRKQYSGNITKTPLFLPAEYSFRSVFRTMSKIYDGAFLQILFTTKSYLLFLQKKLCHRCLTESQIYLYVYLLGFINTQ